MNQKEMKQHIKFIQDILSDMAFANSKLVNRVISLENRLKEHEERTDLHVGCLK